MGGGCVAAMQQGVSKVLSKVYCLKRSSGSMPVRLG